MMSEQFAMVEVTSFTLKSNRTSLFVLLYPSIGFLNVTTGISVSCPTINWRKLEFPIILFVELSTHLTLQKYGPPFSRPFIAMLRFLFLVIEEFVTLSTDWNSSVQLPIADTASLTL